MKPAHIRDDVEQSVQEHLKNVAEYCSFCAEKVGLKACGALIGWLHDVGKFTDAFEMYIRTAVNTSKKQKGPDHSTAGAVWVTQLVTDKDTAEAQLTAQIMAITIMSHHGGIVDIFDIQGTSPYLKRLDKLNENDEWCSGYKQVQEEMKVVLDIDYLKSLFEESVKEIHIIFSELLKYNTSSQELRFGVGVVVKYLYSCLIDADRYDTATFMDNVVMHYPEEKQSFWEELIKRYEENLTRYKEDTPINQLRSEISKACYKSAFRPPGIYTLNCPTGAGKTMASLRFALHHAKEYHKERIFFIIPFITITEQNAAEIRHILSKKEKDDLIENNILELHSAKEEDMCKEDTLKTDELIAERLSQPIIFTTMVRFLNTFFASGTKNIRGAHQFARSIIIFDEIQTIPSKCIAIFNGLLNFLSKVCDATIILSTATQPLLNHVPGEIPSLQIEDEPEIAYCNTKTQSAFKRTEIIDKTQIGGNSKSYLTELIWQEAVTKGNALVVLNTKSSVAALYEEMNAQYGDSKEHVRFYVLTTNLYPNHRKKIIAQIRQDLKKEEKIIVISTQLIEAGVDISFKSVFRALAGLDNIIQSAGRCNRHGENGVGQYGNIYLINPDFETLGSLADIKKGKATVETLLSLYQKNPVEFNEDLSSIKSIEAYFKGYYHEQQDNMTYRFKDCLNKEYLMYELLSDNKKIINETKSNNTSLKGRAIPLGQSFKTAAQYFKAIDSIGKAVVIQHGEGKNILIQLLTAQKNEDKYQLIHKLQAYTVNISQGAFKQLEGAVHYYEDLGIYVLNENYYDEMFGVSMRPVSATFYNF